jgi:hypothetical protein
MPSAQRILERLPSLYRPEADATDLFTQFVRAIGARLDGLSKESSDVMQAHWFASADGALFSEFVRRSRELLGEPPVRRTDDIVRELPYLADLPRLAGLLDRAPWLDPPLSRDKVEDFRRRIADVVTMYRQGLGTLAALRLATRIALPVTDRGAAALSPTRPFTVEELAPLRTRTLAVHARGQPLDCVGPLMTWNVDSGSQKAVLPTAFIVGVAPVAGVIDATQRPVLERVRLADNTGTALAYTGDLAPGLALALWPAYRSHVATTAGVDVAESLGSAESTPDPTAAGPWAASEGPAGTVVAFFQSADQFLWAAANQAGQGSVWRTDGAAWLRVLGGLPEVRCLAGRGQQLLIGLATGVTALDLYTPEALPLPDPAALSGPEVHALAVDGAGQWWAATSAGAAQLGADLALTPLGPGARPATRTPLYAVFIDADGTVFFGGELGIFQLQPGPGRWYSYAGAKVDEASPDWLPFDPAADALPNPETVFLPPVRCLRRGPDSALWLGTDKGLARYLARENRRTFSTLLEAFPAVTQSRVHAFAEDERSQLWFATDTGLLVFDGADWWQRKGGRLVRLLSEPLVRSPLERGAGELTFFRHARSAGSWQALTPGRDTAFVALDPAPAAAAETPVLALAWTDGVQPELGAFDGETFTPSGDVPAPLRMRFKPDAVRVLDGGIPAIPRLLPSLSDWRYLSLEPETVPQPSASPAWTVEGRLLPEPTEGPAPLEGRYLEALLSALRDQVFAFNPAARVWMRWSPRELLSVLVRLRRISPDEVVDPLVLERVFEEVSRVRPAAVRLGLAVDHQLVRVG